MDTIDKINIRLKKLSEYLEILRRYKGTTSEQLRQETERRSVVERQFELAIQAVIDIANMLNAEFRFRPAEDAEESIVILGEAGVLDSSFAEEFAKVAGFRNVLVHDYLKIDYDLVAEKLNTRLGDFDRFAKEVAQYLS